MENKPFISVIVPCRNEEKFIGRFLESLIHGDYPKEKMEILVVDGKSEDKTKEVVAEFNKKYAFIKILDNPKKITPTAMNIGIKNAKGDLITKTDAHSIYPKDYLSKCVRYIDEYSADAVGGLAKASLSAATLTAKAITLTLSSIFGAGGGFRIGADKPIWTDTAFGICYRREVFKKIGFFNENLAGSQDFELNLRLKKAGGKILLAPDIEITYFPKTTLKEFFLHNIKDGVWAILPMKYGTPPFKLRHFIPLFFVLGIFGPLFLSVWYRPFIYLTIGVIGLYLLASLFFSVQIALKEKNHSLIPFLIAAFAVRHFGYGLGSLIGLIRLII